MIDHRIKNIGIIIHADKDGYLIPIDTVTPIQSPWDELVECLSIEYKKHLGSAFHSFYIRGSIARGTAVEGISDVDGLLLLNDSPDNIDLSWQSALNWRMLDKYTFATKLDIAIKNVSDMAPDKNPVGCFMLKVMARCIAGEDIRLSLPQIKPGPAAFVSRWKMREMLIPREVSSEKSRQVHLAKWILRAGMELVMEEEQAFSRDLYPCYQLFIKHYPEHTETMHRVLKLALFPTAKKNDTQFLESEIGQEIARLLDKKYPYLKK